MRYYFVDGASHSDDITFLPVVLQEAIKQGRGWLMVGEDEQKAIQTVGVFTLREDMAHTMELAYIYTVPEARVLGYAMGLLYTAENFFMKNGITHLVSSPFGKKEDIYDVTQFLFLAGFEPVMMDGHVYIYDRNKILQRDVLKPYMNSTQNKYIRLSQREINYYNRNMADQLPGLFRSLLTECDENRSLFAVENDEIMAAILVGKDRREKVELLNIYVNPKWKGNKQLLTMLVQVLKEIKQDNCEIDILVDNEKLRKLLQYVLGEADTDLWVQHYIKELTELNEGMEELVNA